MSRLVQRPIEVELNHDEQPCRIIDQGFTHLVVQILDQWLESGTWWEGESNLAMYRILTVENYIFDIEHVLDSCWSIYKVWD